MIQDDDQFDFKADHHLTNCIDAQHLGRKAAHGSKSNYSGVLVFVGLLESNDLRRLSRNQRNGVRYFWTEYFELLGTEPRWSVDLSGMTGFTTTMRLNPIAKPVAWCLRPSNRFG